MSVSRTSAVPTRERRPRPMAHRRARGLLDDSRPPTIAPPAGAWGANEVLGLQRTVGNQVVQRLIGGGVVQRRAGNIPTSTALKDVGPKEIMLTGESAYNAVLDSVDLYLDTGVVPEADHGKQIYVMTEMLLPAIATWERKEGPVTKAIKSSVFGKSRTDKRRLALKQLKEAIGVEDPAVRTQGHTAATAEHDTDRKKLKEYLDNGLASDDRRLKNSCEWIKTAGKALLYAVTPTGDSYARLKKGKKNPAKDEAWFPKGTSGSPGDVMHGKIDYNKDDLSDNTTVNLDDDGKVTGGWNTPGIITITSPSKKSEATVWETLRHEVQHDADMNKGRDAQANVRKAAKLVSQAKTKGAKEAAEAKLDAENSLTRYKTEYRAYNYQEGSTPGPYAALDNTVQDKDFGGKKFSARQLAIFKHIYGGYAYTKKHWDADSDLVSGKFKDAVVTYWNPDTEGVNKYNSARVDDFYKALDAIGGKAKKTSRENEAFEQGKTYLKTRDISPVLSKVSDVKDAKVQALLVALDALHGDDADYIVNESPAMMKKVSDHLDGAAKTKVLDKLHEMASFSKLTSLFD